MPKKNETPTTRMTPKRRNHDAQGEQLLAQHERGAATAEIIERDDGYIDVGSKHGNYFEEYEQWSPLEQRAVEFARGRVLDIGCGAGRHGLYLQQQGCDVTGIDVSPGAIKVCKARGLKKALTRPVSDIDKFAPAAFDTVIMLGNNFGLFGNALHARRLLKKLRRITSPDARIIAGTRNPYATADPNHLAYHRRNRQRGRMPGQIRMRIRFERAISPWFDYLFVSPDEMTRLLQNTDWRIDEFVGVGRPNYFAIIGKRERRESPS
jgi:SAM-dependent methyltransferase